ncbi:MAG TPA: class I SAM-dependent methyltransferase [Solirubrobacteraceae bacterium]|jgi:ubiquinone/menaquinone biosynthesis C-methylase UbiE|nr:class I SAM-dependent methyltransferase [Solirubrobacteraceae bacterium]
MSLLDAGCGPGTITVGLAAIVAPGKLVAVDISPDEVAQTEAALRAAGHENARTEVASILELPFEDCSFDAVFSHAVLDYLVDPVAGVLDPAGSASSSSRLRQARGPGRSYAPRLGPDHHATLGD